VSAASSATFAGKAEEAEADPASLTAVSFGFFGAVRSSSGWEEGMASSSTEAEAEEAEAEAAGDVSSLLRLRVSPLVVVDTLLIAVAESVACGKSGSKSRGEAAARWGLGRLRKLRGLESSDASDTEYSAPNCVAISSKGSRAEVDVDVDIGWKKARDWTALSHSRISYIQHATHRSRFSLYRKRRHGETDQKELRAKEMDALRVCADRNGSASATFVGVHHRVVMCHHDGLGGAQTHLPEHLHHKKDQDQSQTLWSAKFRWREIRTPSSTSL
jgi:hypothetical protein